MKYITFIKKSKIPKNQNRPPESGIGGDVRYNSSKNSFMLA